MHRQLLVGLHLLAFAAALSLDPVRAQDSPKELASQAQAILQTHCYRCHGREGLAEGGFDYVLDLTRLAARKKVRPGDPDKSPLFQKVSKGKMPPPEVAERPSERDVATLRQWIEAGAPSTQSVPITIVTEEMLYTWMLKDLEALAPRGRRFVRYFSFAPERNAGWVAAELDVARQALSKLLNSLSWHYRITVPARAHEYGVLLRIDLRDFQWDAGVWNRLLAEYPYGILSESASARAVHVATGTRLPIVRADWFLATASRAPLYYDLLQLPTTAGELERQLRVDVQLNLQQERLVRAGFNGSGISKQNRLLERHDALHGAYWRTYDFEPIPQNLNERELLLPNRRNLFAYPLGPGLTENTFRHAGGELIFNLPNGLQGYMLVNADGLRINKGPTAIVSDPKRPDRAVEAGVSCMGCHVTGILPKADQIRDHVQKNPRYFKKAEAELLLALHPPAEKLKKLMDEDAERFGAALKQCGDTGHSHDLILTHVLRYERDVDLLRAADELGLETEVLSQAIGKSEALTRHLGALRSGDGAISRQSFIQAFADAVRELRLGTPLAPFAANLNVTDSRGDLDPLESQASTANAGAFSPDGRLALLASADKSVIVWELERNIEQRRLIGHTASVWSVAVSPDGKQALSGGADQSVRLWDIETGRELRKLDGHSGLVSAVAFSPTSSLAVSGGYDGTLILWDLEKGEEIRRIQRLLRYPNMLAFAPDGRNFAAVGASTLLVFQVETAGLLRQLDGHLSTVTSVAFSPDGKRLATASDDRTVRVWDISTGKLVRVLSGHEGYVKAVAFSHDGRQLATGGSDRVVRVFNVETGTEMRRFKPLPDTVVSIGFDGSERVLAVARNGVVKTWGPAKAATPPVVQAPTAEYVRATKNGLVREAEFYLDENEAGWSIRSITFAGANRLTVAAEYERGGRLRSAEVVLDDGKEKKAAQATCDGAKFLIKRVGQKDQEFPAQTNVIVTSAPDWTDTYLLCRRYDRVKGGKQEFAGLWVHPTQPARAPTFSIERQGEDKVQHQGKEIMLARCLIRLRPGSEYTAWVDEQGRMVKLVPMPWREGAGNELYLKGWEKAAGGLRSTPYSPNGPQPEKVLESD
jgi:WD40 repeat protein/mono/diheme cytochrome c family protein